jgi:excisionase family DNA binding protein
MSEAPWERVLDRADASTPISTSRIVFTPSEVAELLGVSRATVYRQLASGAIPVVQMDGGRKFIPKRPFLALFGAEDLAA